MKYLILIISLLWHLLLQSQPQIILNERCENAYQDILSLKFDDAKTLLSAEKQENPDNLYVPYLENYIDFLSVFISEDEELFNRLEENKSDRINRIKKLDEDSPYRNFMLGNINLQWAVARLKFQEYFSAAFEINKAYRLLKSNKESFPEFIPTNISLGVLHIMIGLIPENYRWLLNIINMKGSVEQGKEELKSVLQNTLDDEAYHYLKNETLFYLSFVELNIYSDKNELDYLLSQLEQADATNLLLSYLAINIQMKTGNNDWVLTKFSQLPNPEGYFPFYYLNYLTAESHLRKLDYQQAALQYDIFLKNFNGQNFVKDAYRKIAWSALIKNDIESYKRYIEKASEHGHTNIGQDKDAEREAKSGLIPNIDLVKTRLLFDGGYYKLADSILHFMDTSNLIQAQKIERIYRKARIAHESDNLVLAKTYYIKTIDIGKNNPRYFAGNSALKLGEINEAEFDYPDARFYYQLCLDIDFEEYESGIHSKAKAGLKRVSD